MVKKKKKRSVFLIMMRVLGLSLMGLIAAVVIALFHIDLESLRGDVLVALRTSTGLPVEIDGPVSWNLSLRPQIELNQVRVANAEWANADYAFSAEKIDVTLDLISLFRDAPTIKNIKVYNAVVNLEQNENGEFSVVPDMSDDNTVNNTSQASVDAPTDFPFVEFGLGGLEVQKLDLNVIGMKYKLDAFQIRYIPRAENREYSGWVKSNNKVFPFIVVFSKYAPERKVYPVRIAFATGGDALIANIALEGTSKAPIDFIIRGDIPDVSAIGAILNTDLSKVSDITVNIAGGFDWKKLTLRSSSIAMRGHSLNFSGYVDWSGAKPLIQADLDSDYINLLELIPGLYGNKWIHPNRELNVFKDIPLFGQEFAKMDMDLRVRLDNFIVYRDMNLRDVDVSLKVNGGRLRADVGVNIAGGDVRVAGNGNVDSEGRMYVRVGGRGRNISVGQLLHEINIDDFISELPVNLDMYVEASGSNLSEWMQTISGPVRVYSAAPGYAHSALVANMYGADFLTTLRHSIQDLFRSEKKYNQINISCVAVNTKLREGLVETQNGVAVETNAINVLLTGMLNLGTEKIQLSLTTVPVRGLKLSLTGNVVNSIEITGNLAEPDIQISGAAMAGKVASATGIGLLLAPFTGGIGLVAGTGVGLLAGDLIENWLADDNPCQTALDSGAPARPGDPDWMNMPVMELANTVLDNN